RWRFPWSLAVTLAIVIGLSVAWAARRPAPSANGQQDATHAAALPFQIESREERFATLAHAVAAAGDGAVVLIHGNDRHILVPVDLRGKALTLRAAPASRPILQLAPSTPHGLSGPLLFTDRSLTLDGIDLQCLPDDGLAASTRPAQLVAGDGAPLSLLKCRLHVAHGSAAIVCRNCPTIMLHDCSLHADGLGLCVEVGGDGDCAIDLARSDFRMKEPGAAALSVWAPELRQSANVRLRMEGNAFEVGRVASFASLPAALEIDARGNQFHFQQALLSFAGLS